ncbi:hypothetical protein LZ480_04115 [Solibacillus sp. MA9]|uniref:Uncharacterized protein n=1 Tax=Solibacillus palustris TaxID=2908203 RepID=A0ABS9UAS1_9BACL|nr:hypothetical protein [Solibacillus sp. MA9]MCH7321068.1 hypothetical protein [Solibacillus sp. MA9]
MEALIIAIVIGIISSLFKDKNQKQQPNKKPTKQMPPFSSQPAPRKQNTRPDTKRQNRPKTLEDFANEVFGQLNEKTKPVVQKVEPPLEVVLPQEVSVPQVKERPKMAESTRTLKERPIVEKLKQQSEGLQVVPKNNKELMQAFVMAEVLGPPKARRK